MRTKDTITHIRAQTCEVNGGDDMALDADNLDVDIPSETSLRRAAVVDLYRQGNTFEQIGERLGVSRQRAHQIYWDAMNSAVSRSVEALRAEMLGEIAEARRVANEIMNGTHYAHSNGRVVTDPDTGAKLLDDGPRLDAARTLLAAHTRMSALVGADAAKKLDATIDGALRYEVVGVQPTDVV